jgi:Tol biopolymer transport system component
MLELLRLAISLVAGALLLARSVAADPLGVKLNPPLAPGQSVSTFQLSSDGSRAVFAVGGGGGVFSVPSEGGVPVRLDAGGSTFQFRISPDVTTVVLAARFPPGAPLALYAVPIDGGDLTSLAPDPADWRVSADGSRVLFIDAEGVKAVPIEGGAVSLLSAPLGPNRFLQTFVEQADGSILYLEYECEWDCEFVVGKELFIVPAAGGPALSLAAVAGEGNAITLFGASPETSRVFYRTSEDWIEGRVLYSVPATGGAATQVSAPLGASGQIWDATLSLDGSRVLYFARTTFNAPIELSSVPIEGGAITPLSPAGAQVSSDRSRWRLSPGGGRIVYLAGSAFHSVPVAGGASTQLGPTLLPAASTSLMQISPNDLWVLYRGEQTAGVVELFSVSLLGGPRVRLNAPLPAGGDVASGRFTPDSTRVVYTADQETDGVQELWSVPNRGGTRTKLNPPLTPGGGVAEIAVSAERVVYVADQDVDGVRELYSSPLPPPPPSPRRCGLLGAEAAAMVAACGALRRRRSRR